MTAWVAAACSASEVWWWPMTFLKSGSCSVMMLQQVATYTYLQGKAGQGGAGPQDSAQRNNLSCHPSESQCMCPGLAAPSMVGMSWQDQLHKSQQAGHIAAHYCHTGAGQQPALLCHGPLFSSPAQRFLQGLKAQAQHLLAQAQGIQKAIVALVVHLKLILLTPGIDSTATPKSHQSQHYKHNSSNS